MSAAEEAIRAAFADPTVEFVSIGRSRRGDFAASVKRKGCGFKVHHSGDACEALVQACTPWPEGPRRVPSRRPSRPPSAATSETLDDDLFG